MWFLLLSVQLILSKAHEIRIAEMVFFVELMRSRVYKFTVCLSLISVILVWA